MAFFPSLQNPHAKLLKGKTFGYICFQMSISFLEPQECEVLSTVRGHVSAVLILRPPLF